MAAYVEHASSNLRNRRERLRVLADTKLKDVLQVEGVSRLTCLDSGKWARLCNGVVHVGLQVVSP